MSPFIVLVLPRLQIRHPAGWFTAWGTFGASYPSGFSPTTNACEINLGPGIECAPLLDRNHTLTSLANWQSGKRSVETAFARKHAGHLNEEVPGDTSV
jgi:hypothetical protein